MKKFRVTVDGNTYEVEVELLEDDAEGGSTYGFPSATSAPRPVGPAPSAPPAAPRPAPAGPGSGSSKEVTSPIAGTVIEVKAKPGQKVKENDVLMIIEAMKMNTNISSPDAGTIKAINVEAGQNVQQGQVLVVFE